MGGCSSGEKDVDKTIEHALDKDVDRVDNLVHNYEKKKGEEHADRVRALQARIIKADLYDTYDEDSYLGGGGYSDVYKMFKPSEPDKFYAVKIMKETKALSSDPETVNEVGLMLAAEHENVVRVFEVYEQPGQPMALVMELVEPQLDRSGEPKGPPDLMTVLMQGAIEMDQLAKVVYQTAAGINYLNKELGAFHRDLKPDNILIGREGWDRLRVADFGHGRIVGGEIDEAAAATMNRGTPGYSAPETISDTKEYGVYNQQCDVWSLGVITYMCASGTPPFPIAAHLANTARSRTLKGEYKPMTGPKWSKVPREAKDLISKMLVVDPNQRITMEQILQDPWVRRNAAQV